MLRDIPVLASAADLPLVAWSQRPDTLPTQMSPKASAIFVVSLCRKSFRVLAILAWSAATRRALFERWATTSSASYLANTLEFSTFLPVDNTMPSLSPRSMPTPTFLPCGLGKYSITMLQYQRASCENDPDLMRPSISRCNHSLTLRPLKWTIEPTTRTVWFLNGTHPSERLPRQRSLALREPRRGSMYSSHTPCTVWAGIPINLPAPAVNRCSCPVVGHFGVVLERMALCAVAVVPVTARAVALRCFPDTPSLTR